MNNYIKEALEEFDRMFDLDDYGKSHFVNDKVKAFLQSKLEGIIVELESKLPKLIAKPFSDDDMEIGEEIGFNKALLEIKQILKEYK